MQPPPAMCNMRGQHVPAIRALSASSTRPSQSLANPFHKKKSVAEQRLLQGSDPAHWLWHQENAHQAATTSNCPFPHAQVMAAFVGV